MIWSRTRDSNLFLDYVADRFESELFVAIQSYIADNYNDLDLRLYKVKTIGGIELSDIEVKFVSVSDLPDMEIEFDVAIEAKLEVRESDYHYDESENCRQWFMLNNNSPYLQSDTGYIF